MSEWKKVGVCGVDAGMIWIGDPCYFINRKPLNPEKWGTAGAAPPEKPLDDYEDFLKEIDDSVGGAQQFNYEGGHPGLGVLVAKFGGDGEYPVYVRTDSHGLVREAKIVFQPEDD